MNKYNMRTNFIWIQISCVALSLLSMLTGMPAPAEADGPLPVINYFTADPTFITSGEYTYLSWDVSGGEDTIVFLSAYGVDIHSDAAHLAKTMLNPSQTTTYTLRAINGYGEGVPVTRSITVFVDEGQPPPPAANQPPVASFSVTPANPTTGDTLLSNNTSTDPDGDALTYKWYIGGKLVADSMNWQYPNPPSGSYTIELLVDDGNGGTDTRTESIFVSNAAAQEANQPPVASFSLTPDPASPNIYEGNSTSWDPDGDILKCSWYFNGVYNTAVGDSPYCKISFDPGVWNIKLVVDDGKGGTDTY
ncbi:MAG: PKD domain-containing protein, partial [Dehalococcoidia bacterium]|nr:PKD domain-containing protein [Dehalococcoidia bacterium]